MIQRISRKKELRVNNKTPLHLKKQSKLRIRFKSIRKYNVRPKAIKQLYGKDFLRMDIQLFPNNVFCSIRHVGKRKLLHFSWGGKYGIRLVSKNMRDESIKVIRRFLSELSLHKYRVLKPLFVVISSPISLRRQIMTLFARYFQNQSIQKKLFLYFKDSKVFNGCRARKAIRKKGKRLSKLKFKRIS